jgi:hypothetical protein
MPKFKTKIILEEAKVVTEEVVEAYMWAGANMHFILKFLGPNYLLQKVDGDYHRLHIHVRAKQEVLSVEFGDWIIKKSNGEILICSEKTFDKNYEEIQDEKVAEIFEEFSDEEK